MTQDAVPEAVDSACCSGRTPGTKRGWSPTRIGFALVPAHGGTVLQRARSSGETGHPLEVQFYRFPSEGALQAYLADDRRVALAAERDRVVSRTELMRVTFALAANCQVFAPPIRLAACCPPCSLR